MHIYIYAPAYYCVLVVRLFELPEVEIHVSLLVVSAGDGERVRVCIDVRHRVVVSHEP